ncbi:hypothetical protein ACFFGT_09875 [Mucilaginibacter angelicae]|uniref:Uncharacterized protein n=1 Tax=Mucilaginibacter angelicae TaxID=869718 RepID=A0ABV6L501_9SPHI
MKNDQTFSQQQQKAIDYIRSLEIETFDGQELDTRAASIAETGENEAGFVDAGSLTSFVAGLTITHKEDTLNSTLLAQLAANKAFNREEQTKEWYGKYHEVLENVGWVISAFQFTEYETSASSFTVEKVVIEILTAIATQSEILIAIKMLEALKNASADSKPFKIWDSSSHDAVNGNFQIGTCLESDGNVAMSLGAFHFKATEVKSTFLWFNYARTSIKLYKGAQQVVLNEQIYSVVRKMIIEKLGNNAVNYVANLEI